MCKNYGADLAAVKSHVGVQPKATRQTSATYRQIIGGVSGDVARPENINPPKMARINIAIQTGGRVALHLEIALATGVARTFGSAKSVTIQMLGRPAVVFRATALRTGEDLAK